MTTSHAAADDKKRILKVTAGNLRHKHLYVNGHYDFFPPDCIGPPKRRPSLFGTFDVELDGMNKTVTTDIGRHAANGKPRGFLRDRSGIRRFYAYHGTKPGDRLVLERLAERRYRLSVQAEDGPPLFPPTFE